MKKFEQGSMEQLERLLVIIDTKTKRNWQWLINWIDGAYDDESTYSFEEMLELYENDGSWINYR